jgi:hypothetical protein
VPASVKAQNTFGSELQVIFVECQGTSPDVAEAFAWKMKWMGNPAMWTHDRPIPTAGQGLPEVALIGIDGAVLMQGHPGDLGKKLEEGIASEIAKARKLRAKEPEGELAKARFTQGLLRVRARIEDGRLEEADQLLGELEKANKGNPDLAAERKRLEDPALKEEREASKVWAAFEARVAPLKPFDPANVQKAESLAKRFAGTKTAVRAERFVKLSTVKVY